MNVQQQHVRGVNSLAFCVRHCCTLSAEAGNNTDVRMLTVRDLAVAFPVVCLQGGRWFSYL